MMRDEAERLARRLEVAAATGPEQLGVGGDARADDELAGLVSLAQMLDASAAEPAPRFPTALRERVLATLAEEPPQPVWRAHLTGFVRDAVAAWRYSVGSQIASGAMTAVLLLAAVFVGTGLSVPGDPLYALKDAYQQAQLMRASAPVDVAAVQLNMASTKIEETVRAVDRDRPDSVISSAVGAERLTSDSAETLLEVYRDTGDEEVLAPLSAFVDGHRPIVTGLQERTADVDARLALANLVITLDRVDARAATVLGKCCQPEQQASAFWMMSSPHQLLRECPCPTVPEVADDEPDATGDDNGTGNEGATIPPIPTQEDDDTPRRDAERWREDMRDGWEETKEGVRDTLDDATEGTRETLDDTLDGVDDVLPSPDADTTDGLRDGLDDATDELREDLDDAGDTVDETVDDVTEGLRQESTPDSSDPVDDLLEGQVDGQSQSQSQDPAGAAPDPDDGEPAGDGTSPDDDGTGGGPDAPLEGLRDEEDDGDRGGTEDGDTLP